MNKDIKQYITLSFPFLVLIVALLWISNVYNSANMEESPLIAALRSFHESGGTWKRPENLDYKAGSAESTFLEGMSHFAQKEYGAALQLFHKGLVQPRTDPALPICSYYYINLCTVHTTGAGSVPAVANVLTYLAKYQPLANDTNLLWSMVETIIPSINDYEDAVGLLEKYLDKAQYLTVHTKVWILNTIAMLEHNGEEYVRSLRRFYDVETLLASRRSLTPDLESELLFAQEYIANIKFLLEDYRGAIELYQKVLGKKTDQKEFDNHVSYINLADSYLKLGKIQAALATIQELQEYIPETAEEYVQEVEANIHDILANIFLAEGNLQEAQLHLQKTEEFYSKRDDYLLFNGKVNAVLTKCKFLRLGGRDREAQEILEDLLEEDSTIQQDMRENILNLLAEIYQQTGQEDKLLETYRELLQLDKEFTAILQSAYLEFSEYYRENNLLRQDNSRLKQGNLVAILGIIIISCSLVIILVLLRLLSAKNLTDQLTGIYNRKKLTQLSRTYRRKGTPELFGVVMLDIDHFKFYNDTYGHVAGDQVLKQVAQMLVESVRSNDYVIRYGGEEFLVLLNRVTAPAAQSVCERIHQQLDRLNIPHKASTVSDRVTVSVGLCYQAEKGASSMDKLIHQADLSLYQSKGSGRNRTTVWTEEPSASTQPE